MAMTRAEVGIDLLRGQAQAVGVAVRVGVHAPAAEWRQTLLDFETGEAVPVEPVCRDIGAGVLLHDQLTRARVRLPRDASRRVTGPEVAQPGEVRLALRVVLRAAGVGALGRRC